MTLSLVLLILPYAAETYAMPSCVPLVILWCSCRPMEPTRTRWVRLRVGFKTHIFFFHLSFFPSLSLEEIMVVMETRALSNTKLKTFITAHAQAMFFLLILVKQFSHFWVSGSNAHYIRHVWTDIISYLCGPLSLSHTGQTEELPSSLSSPLLDTPLDSPLSCADLTLDTTGELTVEDVRDFLT